MRWIKIHGNMLSDDRLQHVLDEQRFAGIGLYYFMLQLVECQGEGAIAFNQVIGALERRYSRKKILRFIQDYDLFVLTEEGLVLSVDPIPGYTQEETEELRRSDAIDAVSRARVFARSHVSPGVHAHDTRAGVKEKIRKEKSRGNTLFQKPSVEEVAAYCADDERAAVLLPRDHPFRGDRRAGQSLRQWAPNSSGRSATSLAYRRMGRLLLYLV